SRERPLRFGVRSFGVGLTLFLFFHSSKIPFPPLCPSFPFAGIMKSYEQRLSTNVDVFFQFN
ncbi:MAG TPA: hypothetical protein PLR45_15920, partial [Flavobacteriales bacterium]|nr:hypothetical protein [Flavobacteriales bacterium]